LKRLPEAVFIICAFVYLVLTDDGSSWSRGYLWGSAQPTHRPLIVVIAERLERK
jgi:hypothetical protein